MEILLKRLQQGVSRAVAHSDIVLAVGVIAIIFVMILPLPTLLIDILIGINMSVAIVMLLVALYLPNALSFASFPSVLLITTLFRLAISIATTRLILLQADAGHIVYAFGNFVVGGNLVVGLVVFLILAIVQFLVITKGAERVAEVAARFSLDAMPGKQMSIDGDLRAGAIDMAEAKARRAVVEKESQLYGAMDGAMKFVKGDAIASLIIVAVNLVGGLVIGTLQLGMPAAEAMQTYSVLSIGDGLVAQIPALFIAISAGMIVTRVTNESGGHGNVGREITAQVFARPRALMIASVATLAMAAVPGMPSGVFLALSVVSGVIGYTLMRQPAAGDDGVPSVDAGRGDAHAAGAKGTTAKTGMLEYTAAVPIILEVSGSLRPSLNQRALNDELGVVRRALYYDLGVPFPGIQLRFSESLDAGRYAILLNEVPITSGHLRPGSLLVRENSLNLDALGIAYEKGVDFLPGIATLWTSSQLEKSLRDAGITAFDTTHIVTFHLAAVLKRYAPDFIGVQETRAMLTGLESTLGELIKEVTRILPPQRIAEILQRVVSEGVSVRNMRTILESLLEFGQKEKDSVLLTEYVRSALKRQISHQYTDGQSVLSAYMLTPDVEEQIRESVRQTSSGSYLALDPEISQQIVTNIRENVGNISSTTLRPVLLTSMDIRRYLRKMVEEELYDLPVVSYQELSAEISIQPLGRIGL